MNYLTLYPCEILVEICRCLSIDKIHELTSTINNSLVRENGPFWVSLWFQRTGLICSRESDFEQMNFRFGIDHYRYLKLVNDMHKISTMERTKFFTQFTIFCLSARYNDTNFIFNHLLKYIENHNSDVRLEDHIVLMEDEWGKLLVTAGQIGSMDLIDKILLSSKIDKKYYVMAMGRTGGKRSHNPKTQEYYLFQFNYLLSHLTKQGIILIHDDYVDLICDLVSNANIMLISHGLNHLYSFFSEIEVNRFIRHVFLDDPEIFKYLYDFFGRLSINSYMEHLSQAIFSERIEIFDLIMSVYDKYWIPLKFSEKNYNNLIMDACVHGSKKSFGRLMSLGDHPLSVNTYREIVIAMMKNKCGYHRDDIKVFEEMLSLCPYTFTKEDFRYILEHRGLMCTDIFVDHIREKLNSMK